MVPTEGFPIRLRRAREAAGLSQEGLGKLVGRTGAAISQWERMETAPDPTLWVLIAEKLRVNIFWLIYGRGEMEALEMTKEELLLLNSIRRLSREKRRLVSELVDSLTPPEGPLSPPMTKGMT